MRIQSNFHDYYDGVQSMGFDRSLVYNRHCKTVNYRKPWIKIEDPKIGSYPLSRNVKRGYHCSVSTVVIGFCGKFYTGLAVDKLGILWGDKAQEYANKNQLKVNLNVGKSLYEVFIKHKSPILMFSYGQDGWHVLKDFCLREYNFMALFDAYSAYQEIQMYMSTVLVEQKNPISIQTDKEKVKSHGMDKWSFRKDTPPKRKLKA